MRTRTKFIVALLVLVMITSFSLPVMTVGAEQGSGDPPVEEKATIGTFWWYRGDGGLIYAQPDAQGFAQAMEDDGCTWPIDKNDVENELYDDYLEDSASELIDDVDLAYFVGHSCSTFLGIRTPILTTHDKAEWDNCKWGDDGPNKWVVLATCLAAKDKFAYALQGTNMILGWQTACSDALYGPVFADKIIEGKTLKQAWFETGEECEHVHAIAKILGEDTSVGDDHLKGYGSYADPVVDDTYVYWTNEINGWQECYNFVAPDGHDYSTWSNEAAAYDNIDIDYTTYPDPEHTWTVFSDDQDGWTDPLILTLDDPIDIRGFRIIANKPDILSEAFEELKLWFYEDDYLKTTVTIDNWESGFWRIIDFNAYPKYEWSLTGEVNPTVNRVKIRIREDSLFSFATLQAKISEFDFWEVGDPGGGGGGSGGNGSGDKPNESSGSSSEGLLKELESSQMSSQEIGMSEGMSQPGMGMRGTDEATPSTDYAAYTVTPDPYNADQFAAVATSVGLKGAPTITDDAYLLTGENGKSLSYNTEKGVWRFVNPSKAYPTVTRNPRLPSDGEAVLMATTFMKEHGLSSDTILDATVTYQTQGEGVKGTDTILYEWIIAKNVYFKHEVDGLPILDKTSVTIGEDGSIAAFTLPTHTVELTET